MVLRIPFGFIAFTVTTMLSTASAVVLKDLPHPNSSHFQRRSDTTSCLDLKSAETFVWGGSDNSQSVLGNLTVYMPDEQENIISMDRFTHMLISVNCTNSTIDMAFNDDEAFAYAKSTWDWVNGADNHSFVVVAGSEQCGWNEHRQPFTVSTLEYDDEANIAHLTAVAQNWREAIHTYNLHVGGIPQASLQKRGFGELDFDKDLSIDFNHKLPIDTITVPTGDDLSITLGLANCSTAGSFAFEFTLETILLVPIKAEIKIHPIDVSATLAPKLSLSGALPASKTFAVDLYTIPLNSITIPGGILDLGPEIIFSAGVTVGPIKGTASISGGAVFALDDAAYATVDVLGGASDASGWTPDVQTIPVTLDAQLSGGVKAFVKAEVALVADAFGEEFSVGLAIVPYIRADLSTVTSSSAACGSEDAGGSSEAVRLAPSVGVELDFDVTTPGHGETNPLFNLVIGTLETPLPGLCLPFGVGNVSADSASTGATPSSTGSLGKPSSSVTPAELVPSSYIPAASVSEYASARPIPSTSLGASIAPSSGDWTYASWSPTASLSNPAVGASSSLNDSTWPISSSVTEPAPSANTGNYAWNSTTTTPVASSSTMASPTLHASSTLSTVVVSASSSTSQIAYLTYNG